MDPRVKASAAELERQLEVSQRLVDALARSEDPAQRQGLVRLYELVQESDAAPTDAVLAEVAKRLDPGR